MSGAWPPWFSAWCDWLQPLRVPGFAFAWLEVMSQRKLMPKLLLAPGHKGWPSFQRLLLALLRFQALPHLEDDILAAIIQQQEYSSAG